MLNKERPFLHGVVFGEASPTTIYPSSAHRESERRIAEGVRLVRDSSAKKIGDCRDDSEEWNLMTPLVATRDRIG